MVSMQEVPFETFYFAVKFQAGHNKRCNFSSDIAFLSYFIPKMNVYLFIYLFIFCIALLVVTTEPAVCAFVLEEYVFFSFKKKTRGQFLQTLYEFLFFVQMALTSHQKTLCNFGRW